MLNDEQSVAYNSSSPLSGGTLLSGSLEIVTTPRQIATIRAAATAAFRAGISRLQAVA